VWDLPLTAKGKERVLSAVDAVNTARLKSTVAACDWLTVAQGGRDGVDATWPLAQHADEDPEVQRSVAEAMEPLVTTGEVKPTFGTTPKTSSAMERGGVVRIRGVGSPAWLRRLGSVRSAALKWA